MHELLIDVSIPLSIMDFMNPFVSLHPIDKEIDDDTNVASIKVTADETPILFSLCLCMIINSSLLSISMVTVSVMIVKTDVR